MLLPANHNNGTLHPPDVREPTTHSHIFRKLCFASRSNQNLKHFVELHIASYTLHTSKIMKRGRHAAQSYARPEASPSLLSWPEKCCHSINIKYILIHRVHDQRVTHHHVYSRLGQYLPSDDAAADGTCDTDDELAATLSCLYLSIPDSERFSTTESAMRSSTSRLKPCQLCRLHKPYSNNCATPLNAQS